MAVLGGTLCLQHFRRARKVMYYFAWRDEAETKAKRGPSPKLYITLLLEQVNLAEQLTSSDFGVSTGLFSQGYWEWSRWYYVNVERSQAADKLQPRNINISFNNNSQVPIDCLVFIFYSDEFVINVETGVIDK